jgi:hypothetical protein
MAAPVKRLPEGSSPSTPTSRKEILNVSKTYGPYLYYGSVAKDGLAADF